MSLARRGKQISPSHGLAVALPAARTPRREKYASGYAQETQPYMYPQRVAAERLPQAGEVAYRNFTARNCSQGHPRTPGTSARRQRRSKHIFEYPGEKYQPKFTRTERLPEQAARIGSSPAVKPLKNSWPKAAPPGEKHPFAATEAETCRRENLSIFFDVM